MKKNLVIAGMMIALLGAGIKTGFTSAFIPKKDSQEVQKKKSEPAVKSDSYLEVLQRKKKALYEAGRQKSDEGKEMIKKQEETIQAEARKAEEKKSVIVPAGGQVTEEKKPVVLEGGSVTEGQKDIASEAVVTTMDITEEKKSVIIDEGQDVTSGNNQERILEPESEIIVEPGNEGEAKEKPASL